MRSKILPICFVLLILSVPAVCQRNRPTARPKPTPSGSPTATAIVEPTDKKTDPLWVQIYGARVFKLYQDTHDPQMIYATTPRGLYKTTDGGFRWRFVFAPPFPDPIVTARDNLGYYPPATAMVFAQSKSSPEVMFLGTNWNEDGRWPTIWKSEDGGSNWRDAAAGIIKPTADGAQYFSDIKISPSNALVAYVSVGSAMYKTLNGGKSWGTIRSGTFSMDSTNADHIIVGAAESYDGGTTWTEKKFRSANVWFHPSQPAILFQDTHLQNNRFVYGISEDSGQTWRDIEMNEPMECLAFSPKDDRVIFAGTQGGVYISHNRGLSWKKIFDRGAWSLAVVNDDVIYAAAGHNIWKTSNGGGTWHTASFMLPMPITHASYNADIFDRLCAADDATNTIYVCAHGGFWTTQDSGFNWMWNAVGNDRVDVRRIFIVNKAVFAVTWEDNRPFGVFTISLLRIDSTGAKTVSPANRSAIESFIGISDSDAKTFYFGNVVTDDGGFSWREIALDGDLRQAQIVVSPASSKVAYILAQGDAGGVFATTDGGTTWTRRLERTVVPSIFVADPKEPLTVYTIILNHLYRSRNGGDHWDDLAYLAPLGDFRVNGQLAVNPTDSNVLYLLSSTGLWTSRNAGRSWRLADNPLQGGDTIQKINVTGNIVLGQGRYGIYRLSDSNLAWAVDKWKADETTQDVRKSLIANESDTPITTSTSITTEITSQPASLDELVALIKKLIDAGLDGERSLIDSYLADDYVWRDVGNRKTMDRAKFLSKVKRDKSIRNYSCGSYKMSSEGALTSISYVCEYDISSIVVANHVRQSFTDRFIRVNGAWKLTSEDTIVLPNNR